MPLGEGAQFAGFTVVRLLGSGGMGEVYLVRHPRLPRYEALKILRAEVSVDTDYRRRFDREADLAAGLWHPHIVGVHDRGDHDGQLWISMDYVDGPDTAALLRERYPAGMPTAEVAGIVAAVAEALDYAHHRGLLHRDVKPANVIISRPDRAVESRILLSDFGIARTVDDISGLTVTNMTVGTVAYSAPEQLMGNPIDGRADQYALAASAYHLLTGDQLFVHPNPVAVISAHLNTAPPLPGARRPEFASVDAVFARALAKDPARRFERCTDFAEALARELRYSVAGRAQPAELTLPAPTPPTAGQPFLTPSAGPPPRTPPTRRDKRRVVTIGATTAALITALVVLAVIVTPKLIHSGGRSAQTIAQQREAARLAGSRYLNALASGDTATALSLGASQPVKTQFLTNEVLRAELAITPITDIAVNDAPGAHGDDRGDVQYIVLSAKFGSTLSQARIAVRRKRDQWQLDTTTIAVDIGTPSVANASSKVVALWGVSTNGRSPVAVFPGTVQISSANRYVDISAPPQPLLLDALADDANRPAIHPHATLNDAGRQVAVTAVNEWVRQCYRGVSPRPGCLDVGNDTITVDSDGDFTKTTFNFDPNTMAVAVGGIVTFAARAAGQPSATVTLAPVGTVDLTKDPPVFVRTANR